MILQDICGVVKIFSFVFLYTCLSNERVAFQWEMMLIYYGFPQAIAYQAIEITPP